MVGTPSQINWERFSPRDVEAAVVPVFMNAENERSWVGSSFVINDFLITAGHVLTYNRDCYVVLGDEAVCLPHNQWIAGQVPIDDFTGFDVAIFPMKDITSPLALTTDDVAPHDELTITGWQRPRHQLLQVTTSCLVLSDNSLEDEAYFRIATTDRITHGASGCPIYCDGKVYGLLAMGRDKFEMPPHLGYLTPNEARMRQSMELNTCWVFRATHIARFLPHPATN